MRQYFLTIPRDFEEAAKLDGAGYFKTYWRVMLPLAAPAIAAVTILTFQGIWNEFFWPLIILQDESKYTLTIGISQFVGIYNTQWPELMAASVIAILPVAVDLPRLPALLRQRDRRGRGGEGMTGRRARGGAARTCGRSRGGCSSPTRRCRPACCRSSSPRCGRRSRSSARRSSRGRSRWR